MTELNQVYKCEVCGIIVQVINASYGELVCCKQPMKLQEARTEDKGGEKHVPVIEKKEGGYEVRVGSVEHPMEENHYIEWIELTADGVSYRKYLEPSDKPEAFFYVEGDEVGAREYCNKHNLWKS